MKTAQKRTRSRCIAKLERRTCEPRSFNGSPPPQLDRTPTQSNNKSICANSHDLDSYHNEALVLSSQSVSRVNVLIVFHERYISATEKSVARAPGNKGIMCPLLRLLAFYSESHMDKWVQYASSRHCFPFSSSRSLKSSEKDKTLVSSHFHGWRARIFKRKVFHWSRIYSVRVLIRTPPPAALNASSQLPFIFPVRIRHTQERGSTEKNQAIKCSSKPPYSSRRRHAHHLLIM